MTLNFGFPLPPRKAFRAAICAFLIPLLTSPLHAEEGDPAEGEKLFGRCKACHKVGDNAKNGVGPVLNDVIGRQAGTFPDFRYGDDLVAAGDAGLVWDEEQLFAYLENPRDFLRNYLDDDTAKSKMTFRLNSDAQRRDVIAYLQTLSTAEEDGETEQAE